MKKPDAISDLETAIHRALETRPFSEVLSLVTGVFVSLTVELVRRQGYDINEPITVDGGTQRDITIHAPRSVQTPGGVSSSSLNEHGQS